MTKLSAIARLKARTSSHLVIPFEHRVRAPLRRLLNARQTYRPLFVTGASGGGTSVLAVSLAQHTECAGLVYESDAQISSRSFLHVPTLGRFQSVAEYETFITPKPDWRPDRARRDIQAMLRSYATERGDWVVAKGPDIHLVRAGFLRRCFPAASFVAIFRDPAANIEGLRRKWRVFGEDSLEACMRFYQRIHETYLEEAAADPDHLVLVRYSDLVARPSETIGAIRRRFGLKEGAQRVSVPDVPNSEGKGIRNVKGNRVQMVSDADRRSRERLLPEDLAAIDETLAPLYARMQSAALAP